MNRGYRYFFSIVLTCVFGIATVFVVSTSLWFLRGMIGSSQGVVEVGYGSGSQFMAMLRDNAATQAAQSSLGVELKDYYRFVYTKDRADEYIVGIPTISHQFQEATLLQHHGWMVNRIGWILVATRPVNRSTEVRIDSNSRRTVSFLRGIEAEFKAVFIKGLPVNPIAIGRSISGFASVSTDIGAYATEHRGSIHAVIEYDGMPIHGDNRKNSTQGMQDKNSMFIAIQSDVLQKINNQFTSAVNASIAKNAHFIKTNPDIISQLPSGSIAGFAGMGDQWALGVLSHGDIFKDALLGFMKAEQGARHLVRKGFQLPDGTIGHEYITSSPTITFSSVDQSSECQKSIGYDEQFFLCGNGETIAVSLTQNAAENLLHGMKMDGQTMSGNISGSMLENLFPGMNVKAMEMRGDEQRTDIWVNL